MNSIRVLLADDSPEFLRSATRLLSMDSRIQVVGLAYSGTEVVDLALRLRPDLVLMDVEMPGISGLEATRRIKHHRDAPAIVIVTFHDNCEYRAAAATAGANAFFAKSEFGEQIMPLIERLWLGPMEEASETAGAVRVGD